MTMIMTDRPRIGLALSGASGRAIAHIGVLEVLKENNIPIDYIAACSSGALIAASFATGTMNLLKKLMFNLTVNKLFSFLSIKNVKGGFFNIHNADEEFLKITKGLRFEDVTPKLGFVATDLNTGELVTLSMGDLVKAFKAAVAVPGLFEPVVWGNKILVDGGLVNIVPTLPVRQMGADIVIGVNIAATKFIYKRPLPIWRGYRFTTRLLGLQFIREKILTKLASRVLFQFDSQADFLDEETVKMPGVLSVLSKALDWSVEFSQQWQESDEAADLMLEPRVKHFGTVDFKNLPKIYQEGRSEAARALPEIRRLIDSYGQETETGLAQQPQVSK